MAEQRCRIYALLCRLRTMKPRATLCIVTAAGSNPLIRSASKNSNAPARK